MRSGIRRRPCDLWDVLAVLLVRELLKKSAVTVSNFAIYTKSGSENERNV